MEETEERVSKLKQKTFIQSVKQKVDVKKKKSDSETCGTKTKDLKIMLSVSQKEKDGTEKIVQKCLNLSKSGKS